MKCALAIALSLMATPVLAGNFDFLRDDTVEKYPSGTLSKMMAPGSIQVAPGIFQEPSSVSQSNCAGGNCATGYCVPAGSVDITPDLNGWTPVTTVSARSLQCPCGETCSCVDCQCGSSDELQQLRAYKARMEAWIAREDLRNPARYQAASHPVARQVYQEQPVCVNGQCYLPSQARYSAPTSTPYSGGRYTRFFSGSKSFRGGSCANWSCGR